MKKWEIEVPKSVLIALGLGLMLVASYMVATSIIAPSAKYIGPEEAKSLIEQGTTIVDVRSFEEYNTSHINGSINIPNAGCNICVLNKLRNHDEVILYGEETVSDQLVEYLLKGGVEVYVLEGGYRGWKETFESDDL